VLLVSRSLQSTSHGDRYSVKLERLGVRKTADRSSSDTLHARKVARWIQNAKTDTSIQLYRTTTPSQPLQVRVNTLVVQCDNQSMPSTTGRPRPKTAPNCATTRIRRVLLLTRS